jgi:hypothetical protein
MRDMWDLGVSPSSLFATTAILARVTNMVQGVSHAGKLGLTGGFAAAIMGLPASKRPRDVVGARGLGLDSHRQGKW